MFIRMRAALAVLILVSLPPAAAWAKPADSHDADAGAIKQLVADFTTAFNSHDARAVSMTFTEDAEFINIQAATSTGRSGIEQHLAPLFTGRLKTAHRDVTLRGIRFLRPDLATVDIDYVM